MNMEPFSKRFGLAGGLIYDDAPKTLRIKWWYSVQGAVLDRIQRKEELARILVDVLERSLGLLPGFRPSITPRYESVLNRLLEIVDVYAEPWYKFFDVCGETYRLLDYLWKREKDGLLYSYKGHPARNYENSFNFALEEDNIGWRMKKGQFERVGEAAVDKGIEEAHLLLGHDPRLGGPRQQFERAWQCYNRRPQPDVINCVKDAIGAAEATAQVLSSKPDGMLDKLIKEWSREGIIPKPLDDMIVKLYAYRGKEPGVAHGETEPSPVSVHEAYLVLGVSASLIVYLVNKIR